MQSFPTYYNLPGPCLKYTCIIQFFHVGFRQQGFNYFLNKRYDLAEEIMAGTFAL